MYSLYYLPGACSMAIHVVLNELGQKVTLENVSVPDGQPRSAEFLKVNPRGNVPVLVDDGEIIREGGAIITYLLDKHNSAMLPKSGKERARALEWLMFANASLHPAYAKVFFAMKSITDPAAKDQAIKAAIAQIEKMWEEVDARLAANPYVCGKDVTSADILLTVIANWDQYFPQKVKLGANVKRLLKEITARPAYQTALKLEQVEYKAAA